MAARTLSRTEAHILPFSPASPRSAPSMAITISDTIRPYSMAVAPRSSRRRRLRKIQAVTEGPPGQVRSRSSSQQFPNNSLRGPEPVESRPAFILVVAAAILDEEGRLLLQRALPGKRHAGQWEFPGGKVEPAENPKQALVRAVPEELALTLSSIALDAAGFAEEPASGDRPGIVLLLCSCARWSGQPDPREGQESGWFTLEQATQLELAAMDRPLLCGLMAD